MSSPFLVLTSQACDGCKFFILAAPVPVGSRISSVIARCYCWLSRLHNWWMTLNVKPVSCVNLAGIRGAEAHNHLSPWTRRKADFLCYRSPLLLAVDAELLVDDSQCQARFLC